MEGGAALGGAVDLLSTTVVDATKRVAGFSSQLKRLESTLSSIKPAIEDTEKLNIILDRPPHETEAFTLRLMEAESLIQKCSKVRKWNIFMRFYYSYKLSELGDEQGFTNVNVQLMLNDRNHIHMGDDQGLLV